MNFLKKFIFFVFFIVTLKSYSWGEKGHKIVATIAKKCLTKQVLDSVNYYLKGMSFKDASVWMDKIKKDASYDSMKPWHYINIEKDKTYVAVEEPNVVNQLQAAITTLKLSGTERTKDKINLALKIIFHLVGDLHQPLHDGYAEDRGGNNIKVKFISAETNLHKVWDTEIIEYDNISVKKCLKYINTMTNTEKGNAQIINVVSWMNQSRTYLDDVYNFENDKINKEYVQKNTPIIQKQLSLAGLRLASILFQNFSRK